MADFFQSYGIWILFGGLFALMLWSHTRKGRAGHGGGCCGGGEQHDHAANIEQRKDEKLGSGCH